MRRRALAALLISSLWPVGARALGRHCERVDDACWDCADLAFGFGVPCDDDPCAPSQLCVQRDGAAECHDPTRLCCAMACDRPPGCEGAATACGGDTPDYPTTCTFLSDCPDPFASDAGAPPGDAGAPPLDAGGGGAAGDSGAVFDAAAPVTPPTFRGGGGCACGAGRGSPPRGGWGWLLLSAAFARGSGRRRRGPGRAARGTRPASRAR